jgi:mannose-6-phosphate isomerase-like protein (cupin superfamily)
MSESAGLFRPASTLPVYTEERCSIVELLNTERCEEVSLAECRVVAGETTQLHALQIAERYVIQQGRGIMELARNDTFAIGAGDCVLIPAGCAQRVRNTGTEDLVFLCVCTPRFSPQYYTVLEHNDTPGIATS